MEYAEFVTQFPEFSDRDQSLVERTIAQSVIECNGYEGLEIESTRNLALSLHIAHNIALEIRTEDPMKGNVKAIESRNEKITFNTKDGGLFDLDSTQYGVRLSRLLDNCYLGGLLV